MKKHNEGYSLVLVLVVLVVLGLVASFILSFSLRNLQSQQASVERMQDRYTAEGEIEKTIAKLNTLIGDTSGEPINLENAEYSEEGKIVITETSDTIRIVCELLPQADAVTVNADGEYIFTNLAGVECVSYEISTVEEVGGE